MAAARIMYAPDNAQADVAAAAATINQLPQSIRATAMSYGKQNQKYLNLRTDKTKKEMRAARLALRRAIDAGPKEPSQTDGGSHPTETAISS